VTPSASVGSISGCSKRRGLACRTLTHSSWQLDKGELLPGALPSRRGNCHPRGGAVRSLVFDQPC
jgi:hypothetical protein